MGQLPPSGHLVPDAITDTHGLIWYLQNDPRLGPNATQIFDECDQGTVLIYIPTICLAEIVYLQEKGRIPADLRTLLSSRLQAGTTGLTLVPLTVEVVNAVVRIPRAEVPDMPDRIIAATALHLGLPLISRDRKIQLSSVPTIW